MKTPQDRIAALEQRINTLQIRVLSGVLKADFKESEHPRADDGQFGNKSGESKPTEPAGDTEKTPVKPDKKNPTITHINEHTKSGNGSNFSDIRPKQAESIASALKDTLGDHKVTTIGYSEKPLTRLGYYATYEKGIMDKIELQKTFVKNPEKIAAKHKEVYEIVRQQNIIKNQKIIDTHPDNKELIIYHQEKLDNLKATVRWAIYTDAKDPLYAVVKHESYHAIYFNKPTSGYGGDFTDNLESYFGKNLRDEGATVKDWCKVSDYAAHGGFKELFAETGTAIDIGIEIPENIKRAFLKTIGRV